MAKPLMVSLPVSRARVLQRTLEPGPSWRRSRRRLAVGNAAGGTSTLFPQISILPKIPLQSFTREISRLIVAVAAFTGRVTWYAHTARNDDEGKVSDGAVEPLMKSLLPWEGGGCEGDGG